MVPSGLATGDIAMKSKAIGRAALIIAAGLCACLLGPLQPTPGVAAPAATEAASQDAAVPVAKKKAKRHARTAKKKAAPAKPSPAAEKPKDETRLDGPKLDSAMASPEAKVDLAGGDLQSKAENNLQNLQSISPTGMPVSSAALPTSVANANAQLLPVAATDGAPPITAFPAASQDQAGTRAADDGNVVAPDEVNELDRAVDETPKPTVMAATTPAPDAGSATTVGTAQVSSATSNDGAWDKASLIGKIFIAAGGLLTLASAARMFMA
jgi:hypothetical protein